MEKKLSKTVAGMLLKKAEGTADKRAGQFCRYWIGVERVPQKLLNRQASKHDVERRGNAPSARLSSPFCTRKSPLAEGFLVIRIP